MQRSGIKGRMLHVFSRGCTSHFVTLDSRLSCFLLMCVILCGSCQELTYKGGSFWLVFYLSSWSDYTVSSLSFRCSIGFRLLLLLLF